MIAHHRELVDRSMSTSMTPYRQNAIVEIEVHPAPPVVRTGLIVATSPKCSGGCDLPASWDEVVVTKVFFGLFSKENKTTHYKFPINSVYRCSDCLMIYRKGYKTSIAKECNNMTWINDELARTLWFTKTGEDDEYGKP